ncbi:hypothetical protein [Pontibacter virosus]|nr:hypothetical protein [Pontibacter virosus]
MHESVGGDKNYKMFGIISLVFSAVLAYFFFKPYLKHPATRKKLIKTFLILLPIAVIGSYIGTYIIEAGQPDSFNEGVELVKEDKRIIEKIGSYKSLWFNENELPKETDNPADLFFELEGSKGVVQVKSKVAKDNTGRWYLVEVQDSLIEQY